VEVKVAAVLVTYNRKELLVDALTALRAQTRPADTVIVVDNASTDGTADLVRERFAEVELLQRTRNLGGAGGFAAGIARALEGGADLIWLMDDDTVPRPPALAALLTALLTTRASTAAVLVASRVVWTDGRDHPMNTPRTLRAVPGLPADCARIRSASFVSVLIDSTAVRERGLPIADYFLWNDDFEFTTRLLRGRLGLLCRSSIVVHRTATFGSADVDPGPRFFYEVRNKVWLFTRSPGLAPVERLLYAGSTVRRWIRTFARSADRATLRRELRRGLIAGVRTRPRPTDDVLGPRR
jgi:rhamnopyranosyl-N-acetylglucosaminyl-diphospho-decaprenol beta-1,3/1,4-galactofuranosyltransferase